MDGLTLISATAASLLSIFSVATEVWERRSRRRRQDELQSALERGSDPLAEGKAHVVGTVGERVDGHDSEVGEPFVTTEIWQRGKKISTRSTSHLQWFEHKRETSSVPFYLELSGSRERVIIDVAESAILRVPLVRFPKTWNRRSYIAAIGKGDRVAVTGVLAPSQEAGETSDYRRSARVFKMEGAPARPLVLTTEEGRQQLERSGLDVVATAIRAVGVATTVLTLLYVLIANSGAFPSRFPSASIVGLGVAAMLMAFITIGDSHWMPDDHLPWYERRRFNESEPLGQRDRAGINVPSEGSAVRAPRARVSTGDAEAPRERSRARRIGRRAPTPPPSELEDPDDLEGEGDAPEPARRRAEREGNR